VRLGELETEGVIVAAEFDALALSEFQILDEFLLTSNGDEFDLVISLRTRMERPSVQIRLKFVAITNLHMKDFQGRGFTIQGFDITCIKDRQWEGVGYEIVDYEDGCIGFFAAEVFLTALDAS
jgi:hypothetical protein